MEEGPLGEMGGGGDCVVCAIGCRYHWAVGKVNEATILFISLCMNVYVFYIILFL